MNLTKRTGILGDLVEQPVEFSQSKEDAPIRSYFSRLTLVSTLPVILIYNGNHPLLIIVNLVLKPNMYIVYVKEKGTFHV